MSKCKESPKLLRQLEIIKFQKEKKNPEELNCVKHPVSFAKMENFVLFHFSVQSEASSHVFSKFHVVVLNAKIRTTVSCPITSLNG